MCMYACDICGKNFATFQGKANHIRWKHPKTETGYSEAGLSSLRTKIARNNSRIHGEKIVETIDCPRCGSPFERSYRKIEKAKKFCSRSCANSRDWSSHPDRERIKAARRDAALSNHEWTLRIGNSECNNRFSSKAERELSRLLGENFKRHGKATLESGRRIDIDIFHKEKNIWIESDGPYHFKKIHKNHDFENTRHRDIEQENHCINNGILLIRVNNFDFSIIEQLEFIEKEMLKWKGERGKVSKLY
jgi:protein-arginine kinase activator protein McsA